MSLKHFQVAPASQRDSYAPSAGVQTIRFLLPSTGILPGGVLNLQGVLRCLKGAAATDENDWIDPEAGAHGLIDQITISSAKYGVISRTGCLALIYRKIRWHFIPM